jgi:hypothetical protein
MTEGSDATKKTGNEKSQVAISVAAATKPMTMAKKYTRGMVCINLSQYNAILPRRSQQ